MGFCLLFYVFSCAENEFDWGRYLIFRKKFKGEVSLDFFIINTVHGGQIIEIIAKSRVEAV